MCQETNFDGFLDRLASSSPVPGGGGASALVGAVGVALGSMVGNLTTGKKKYEAYEADIQRILAKTEKLRIEMVELIEKDAEVFEPLSKAYGLPKNTDEEKKHRDVVMEEALKLACSVPIEIMEKCLFAIDLHEELAQKGSKLAVSDVGVGVIMCHAALKGASLNVFINTKLMKDRAMAEALNSKADDMLKAGVRKAETIFNQVEKELR
jgi:methenyltetrahydrofolate cyclohydrolase